MDDHGGIMNKAERKDTFEGAELSLKAKKKLEAEKKKKQENEFVCLEEGFSCVSNIVVMEAKNKPKRKRKR